MERITSTNVDGLATVGVAAVSRRSLFGVVSGQAQLEAAVGGADGTALSLGCMGEVVAAKLGVDVDGVGKASSGLTRGRSS